MRRFRRQSRPSHRLTLGLEIAATTAAAEAAVAGAKLGPTSIGGAAASASAETAVAASGAIRQFRTATAATAEAA